MKLKIVLFFILTFCVKSSCFPSEKNIVKNLINQLLTLKENCAELEKKWDSIEEEIRSETNRENILVKQFYQEEIETNIDKTENKIKEIEYKIEVAVIREALESQKQKIIIDRKNGIIKNLRKELRNSVIQNKREPERDYIEKISIKPATSKKNLNAEDAKKRSLRGVRKTHASIRRYEKSTLIADRKKKSIKR